MARLIEALTNRVWMAENRLPMLRWEEISVSYPAPAVSVPKTFRPCRSSESL